MKQFHFHGSKCTGRLTCRCREQKVVINRFEEEIHMRPISDTIISQRNIIFVQQTALVIVIEDQDESIVEELLLCLYLSLQVCKSRSISHFNVEERSCQYLHHHCHLHLQPTFTRCTERGEREERRENTEKERTKERET